MNEELKVKISAETSGLQKGIQKATAQVEQFGKKAAQLGKIAVGAFAAVTTALVAVEASTRQYREEQAKLATAFKASGSDAKQATTTYKNLYRVLGDSGKATEAAGHLAKLTTNEQELAEWATACQGIYATFGDSLPIEGLTEAANETAKVGKVTGTLADALNWAGVSEDAFNESLAACNSEAEREKLIRTTLNGLYNDAARIYEENNKELIAQREAQANLDAAMGNLGKAVTPLVTELTNLASTLLTALQPAIDAIIPYITTFVSAISKAVQWVQSFIKALLGTSADSTEKLADNAESISSGFKGANSGAGKLNSGLAAANKTAEKLKKNLAGFDELNVMASASSGASSGGGGGAGAGGGIASGGFTAGTLDTSGITGSLDDATAKVEETISGITGIFQGLITKFQEWIALFAPTGEALKGIFTGLQEPATNALTTIGESFTLLKDETLAPLVSYLLEEFVPNIVNSFTTNLAPMFTDTMGLAIEQWGKNFELACETIDKAVDDILLPALDLAETMVTESLETVGKEWEKRGNDITEQTSLAFDKLRELWTKLYDEWLKPIFDKFFQLVNELWTKHLKPLWDNIVKFVMSLWEVIMRIWNVVLAPVIDWLITVLKPLVVGVITTIMGAVKAVIGPIIDAVSGIIKALTGLMDFISGVFSGDWERAWQGICDFFGGIWNGIWGLIKGVINLIIGGVNTLWSAIYGAIAGIVNGFGSIIGAIGGLFGQEWGFSMPAEPPLIPYLAKGGIVDGATLAMVGERGKEAVLPLENNTEWMDILAERLSTRQETPTKIVLTLDGKELGWASIHSINGITEQTGELQLALA